MKPLARTALNIGCGLTLLSAAPAIAADASYPDMAPAAAYRIPSREAEIALARSAAPASISSDAEVMVLGPHGYETAETGKNGFVCLVLRSWTAGFGDSVFWNPHVRGPACLNAGAVKTVLPHIIERSQWVQAGTPKAEMLERTKAQIASGRYLMPELGAMAFMQSRQQYLSDDGSHHWHPHLMFYVAGKDGAPWGADLAGSPIMAGTADPEPVTTLFIPVGKWSDGTAEMMEMK